MVRISSAIKGSEQVPSEDTTVIARTVFLLSRATAPQPTASRSLCSSRTPSATTPSGPTRPDPTGSTTAVTCNRTAGQGHSWANPVARVPRAVGVGASGHAHAVRLPGQVGRSARISSEAAGPGRSGGPPRCSASRQPSAPGHQRFIVCAICQIHMLHPCPEAATFLQVALLCMQQASGLGRSWVASVMALGLATAQTWLSACHTSNLHCRPSAHASVST